MKKHIAKNIIIALLLFAGISSLLSLVCATTPELPSGETVGQWVWLGKAALLFFRMPFYCFFPAVVWKGL